MYKINTRSTVNAVGFCALLGFGIANAAPGDAEISANAGPWPITIKTCAHDAGAICSLTWRGKQFIDDYDHGRQLQSAAAFDFEKPPSQWFPNTEVYNPTEAGAANVVNGNAINPSPSSSVLQGMWTTSNALATQTKMAYFIPFNNRKVSDHILNKQVTIGAHGLAHVIEYLTLFTVPTAQQSADYIPSHNAQFEALTAYMPAEFSKIYTVDMLTAAVTPISWQIQNPGGVTYERNKPLIVATPCTNPAATQCSDNYAMGIFSPDLPQASPYLDAGYGSFRHSADPADGELANRFPDNVVKINTVYRYTNPSGQYGFRTYVVIGSLDNVRISMQQLYSLCNPSSCGWPSARLQ